MICEIGKKNIHFRECPVCGKNHYCCTSTTDNVVFVICKYLGNENIPGLKYIKETSSGNYMYLVKTGDYQFTPVKKPQVVTADKQKVLEPCLVDKYYRLLVSRLSLLEEHKNILLKVGWDEDMIKYFNIVSFPDNDKNTFNKSDKRLPKRYELAGEIMKSFNLDSLGGLPGAYFNNRNRGYWSFAGYPGIVFPVVQSRKMVALKIRLDTNQKSKYRILSSVDKDCGCSPGSPSALYEPKFLKDSSIAYITEGEKKAMALAYTLGVHAISVPGVTSYSSVYDFLPYLEKAGVRLIILAFDMDKFSNPRVSLAEHKLMLDLINKKYSLANTYWDSYMGKGIDDVLLQYKSKPSLLNAPSVFEIKKNIKSLQLQIREEHVIGK
jgi:hypothetical protein